MTPQELIDEDVAQRLARRPELVNCRELARLRREHQAVLIDLQDALDARDTPTRARVLWTLVALGTAAALGYLAGAA
jgi:hypothetical protein